MKLTVVGCSPAWPNPGGKQSGYLVEGPGRLLLDCGPGVLGELRAREGWPRLDAIAITHFHLDHWGDIVPWVWGSIYRFGDLVPPPQLWLPPDGMPRMNKSATASGSRRRSNKRSRFHRYADGTPSAPPAST